MAHLDVSASSALAPADAWKIASDLQRIDEWMTIFGGWRSSVPSNIDEGTKLSSLIKVRGFAMSSGVSSDGFHTTVFPHTKATVGAGQSGGGDAHALYPAPHGKRPG